MRTHTITTTRLALLPRTTRPQLIVSSVVAVFLIALIAVPAALAAKPTRAPGFVPETFVIPAGFGCSFAVEGQTRQGDWTTITEFSDGRTVIHTNAHPTLTNPETGDTFQQSSEYQITETFDPETNAYFDEIDGRIFVSFWPGDQGPFGEVEEPGLLLSVIGHQEWTYDADTGLVTSYSLDGTAPIFVPLSRAEDNPRSRRAARVGDVATGRSAPGTAAPRIESLANQRQRRHGARTRRKRANAPSRAWHYWLY
jgi:hypothetical protein